jgi:hypothetical protein
MRLMQLGLVTIGMTLGVVWENTIAQNNVHQWSTVDAGFAHSVSGNSSLRSTVGQSVVGNARSSGQMIQSGFFADTLFRATLSAIGRDIAGGVPAVFQLSQNFPNPFNPTTTIRFQLAGAARVTLKVYDVLGREVASLVNDDKAAGEYTVTFNATAIASGVYIYRFQARAVGGSDYIETRKLVLLR